MLDPVLLVAFLSGNDVLEVHKVNVLFVQASPGQHTLTTHTPLMKGVHFHPLIKAVTPKKTL